MTAIAWAVCLGEASLVGSLVIFLRLSAKLGEVTKMRPYYLGYYVAIGFVSVALLTRLVAASLWYDPLGPLASWIHSSWYYALLHHGALALGLTIALPITAKYWGWLLREK